MKKNFILITFTAFVIKRCCFKKWRKTKEKNIHWGIRWCHIKLFIEFQYAIWTFQYHRRQSYAAIRNRFKFKGKQFSFGYFEMQVAFMCTNIFAYLNKLTMLPSFERDNNSSKGRICILLLHILMERSKHFNEKVLYCAHQILITMWRYK